MKKIVSLLLVLVLFVSVVIPVGSLSVSAAAIPGDTVAPCYVPEQVKWYHDTVEFADGGFYMSPWTYKELRLPSASSTYSAELVLKYTLYNTTYDGKKAKSVSRWEYVYTINP